MPITCTAAIFMSQFVLEKPIHIVLGHVAHHVTTLVDTTVVHIQIVSVVHIMVDIWGALLNMT